MNHWNWKNSGFFFFLFLVNWKLSGLFLEILLKGKYAVSINMSSDISGDKILADSILADTLEHISTLPPKYQQETVSWENWRFVSQFPWNVWNYHQNFQWNILVPAQLLQKICNSFQHTKSWCSIWNIFHHTNLLSIKSTNWCNCFKEHKWIGSFLQLQEFWTFSAKYTQFLMGYLH